MHLNFSSFEAIQIHSLSLRNLDSFQSPDLSFTRLGVNRVNPVGFGFFGFLKLKLHPKLEPIKVRVEVNWISGYRVGLQLNPDNPTDQIQVRVNRVWLFGF